MTIPDEWIIAGSATIIMSLVAVIYKNLSGRVKAQETKIDKMLPLLIVIKEDVKHIKKNCTLCDDEPESKEENDV